MSKKYKLIQDADDDGPWASIKRHAKLVGLIIGLIIVTTVVLTFISFSSAMRQRADIENQRAIAAMTKTAMPTRTPRPTPTPLPPVRLNAKSDSNLYAGPGYEYAIVGKTQGGAPINLIARDTTGDWYQPENGWWIANDSLQYLIGTHRDLPVAP